MSHDEKHHKLYFELLSAAIVRLYPARKEECAMNFCGTTDGQINGMIEEAQLQLEDPFLERGQRADLIDHIDICMIELAKRQNRKIFQPLD